MEPVRVGAEIAGAAAEHGARTCQIPIAIVVKRDGDLNQTLQELPLCAGSHSPDVLQHLVGREELGTIE